VIESMCWRHDWSPRRKIRKTKQKKCSTNRKSLWYS
jgi:hypothetical protein